MLGKLLKYDLRYFYKSWIFAAVSSVLFAIVGGICSQYAFTSSVDDSVQTATSIGYMISIICIGAFFAVGFLAPFYRFYQNFYTDEGYLTFTLPATKQHHLLSKFIFCLISIVATSLVMTVDVAIMNIIEYGIETGEEAIGEFDPWSLVYAAEIFVIIASCVVSGVLIVFLAISVITKFSKKMQAVIAVVGFYGVFVLFVMVLMGVFNIDAMVGISWKDLIPEGYMNLVNALLLLSVDVLLVTVASLLYLIEYRVLDRHLNLA